MKIVLHAIEDLDLREELEKVFTTVAENLVEKLSLDISCLEQVIVPRDYGDELQSFQRMKGIAEGYTQKDGLLGLGKTIKYYDNADMKMAVFLNPLIIQGILDESSRHNALGLMIANLTHELCHVSDITKRSNFSDWASLENGPVNVNNKSHWVADKIWEEYYACRMEIGLANLQQSEWFFPELVTISNSKEKEIKNLRREFKFHRIPIGDLVLPVERASYQLLVLAGRMIGYDHGALQPGSIEDKHEKLKDTALYPVWTDMDSALQTLFDSYPHWQGIEILDDLADVVRKTWNYFGVDPSDTPDGIYWSVPNF